MVRWSRRSNSVSKKIATHKLPQILSFFLVVVGFSPPGVDAAHFGLGLSVGSVRSSTPWCSQSGRQIKTSRKYGGDSDDIQNVAERVVHEIHNPPPGRVPPALPGGGRVSGPPYSSSADTSREGSSFSSLFVDAISFYGGHVEAVTAGDGSTIIVGGGPQPLGLLTEEALFSDSSKSAKEPEGLLARLCCACIGGKKKSRKEPPRRNAGSSGSPPPTSSRTRSQDGPNEVHVGVIEGCTSGGTTSKQSKSYYSVPHVPAPALFNSLLLKTKGQKSRNKSKESSSSVDLDEEPGRKSSGVGSSSSSIEERSREKRACCTIGERDFSASVSLAWDSDAIKNDKAATATQGPPNNASVGDQNALFRNWDPLQPESIGKQGGIFSDDEIPVGDDHSSIFQSTARDPQSLSYEKRNFARTSKKSETFPGPRSSRSIENAARRSSIGAPRKGPLQGLSRLLEALPPLDQQVVDQRTPLPGGGRAPTENTGAGPGRGEETSWEDRVPSESSNAILATSSSGHDSENRFLAHTNTVNPISVEIAVDNAEVEVDEASHRDTSNGIVATAEKSQHDAARELFHALENGVSGHESNGEFLAVAAGEPQKLDREEPQSLDSHPKGGETLLNSGLLSGSESVELETDQPAESEGIGDGGEPTDGPAKPNERLVRRSPSTDSERKLMRKPRVYFSDENESTSTTEKSSSELKEDAPVESPQIEEIISESPEHRSNDAANAVSSVRSSDSAFSVAKSSAEVSAKDEIFLVHTQPVVYATQSSVHSTTAGPTILTDEENHAVGGANDDHLLRVVNLKSVGSTFEGAGYPKEGAPAVPCKVDTGLFQ